MTDTLESILSGAGEATPASEPVKTEQPKEQVQEAQQPPAQEPEGDPAQAEDKEQGMVPVAALHAERNKVKRYTEQVAEFQQKIAESDAKWEQRISQLLAAQQPRPQAPAQAQQAPDIFDDPNAFVDHGIRQAINPIQQQLFHNARLIAGVVHGQESVEAAVQAFDQLGNTGQLDPAEYQRIMSSPNPYDEAVKWHKRKTALDEIGSDPASYKERLKAELLAELQGTTGAPPAAQSAVLQTPVMPSNLAGARNVGSRSGPEWGGPPKLDDIFNRKS